MSELALELDDGARRRCASSIDHDPHGWIVNVP